MKIAIIGPGIMPIPPIGWGAVECLIWDYAIELKKLGHEVQIVNESRIPELINKVNNFNPDFVHLQYDDFVGALDYIQCKKKAITSHYGYIEQHYSHPEYNKILQDFIKGDFYIFCLSENIKNTYQNLGVNPSRLFVTPNGANHNLFQYKESPAFSEKSIYLAKIDYRKRQYLYQGIENIYFAGNCVDSRFNTDSPNYLGEWNKDHLYDNLTDYANLVLISDGEADPLVTKEALICGLGLVISEFATANLDLSLPFIDVIPESMAFNIDYIKNIIAENRKKSIQYRKEIRNYGLANHSWEIIVNKYSNLLNSLL
jgi:glycosyltransferase involved in cell wall biosynthesis